MGTKDKNEELRRRKSKLMEMGGPDAVAKQKGRGKLTARERLELLFDPNTFTEIDLFAKHRSTEFGMDRREVPAEGVVTGYGEIDGRQVFAFAQDFTSMGGSLGEMHAAKICKVMDLAMKVGAPVVGLNDSGGARIQEGVKALSGYGQIFYRNSIASGVVPQIAVIMGPCAGGAVYSPAMADWIIMVEKTSHMFITGPRVIKAVTGEEIDFEGLGGARVHSEVSGVSHFTAQSDQSAIELTRELLNYLPSNNIEDPPRATPTLPPAGSEEKLQSIIPDDINAIYDMRELIGSIVDEGRFLEPHSGFAQNIIVAFARIAGQTVGIIANQPAHLAGCLDVDASDKATRFIRFCDAFNIPLLNIVDVPGFLPGTHQEHSGIIRHGAKMLWCYSEATVPKITLIVRKAYGGAYLAMCSKDLGADIVYAWPTAEIAVMGAEGAAEIVFAKEIKNAADPKTLLSEKIAEYRDKFANPYVAASLGYLDEVIEPNQTRAKIERALKMLSTKRETRPPRKHGNIPM